MKAIVDQNLCTGCGICPDVCPAIFHLEGDKAQASPDPIPDGEIEACRDAADQCPVEAISLL